MQLCPAFPAEVQYKARKVERPAREKLMHAQVRLCGCAEASARDRERERASEIFNNLLQLFLQRQKTCQFVDLENERSDGHLQDRYYVNTIVFTPLGNNTNFIYLY